MKETKKLENELATFSDIHQLSLKDLKVSGVQLSDGKLSGLGTISRWGVAELDTKYKKIT